MEPFLWVPMAGQPDGSRESKPYFIGVAPSHLRVKEPLFTQDVELDLIGNVGRIGEDDPCALIGNVPNDTADRLATVIEIDTGAQQTLLTCRLSTPVHFAVSTERTSRQMPSRGSSYHKRRSSIVDTDIHI